MHKPTRRYRTDAAPLAVDGPWRDAPGLSVQVDALLLDPRGQFRPRALVLRAADDPHVEQELLVMQVGEHADGSLSVITNEPLVPGESFQVRASEQRSPDDAVARGEIYLVCGCRPGNRPEDGGQQCWVSVLQPQPGVAAVRHGG